MESLSPSVWDLLRKMVLARGWSEGLYSMLSSEERERKRLLLQKIIVYFWQNDGKHLVRWATTRSGCSVHIALKYRDIWIWISIRITIRSSTILTVLRTVWFIYHLYTITVFIIILNYFHIFSVHSDFNLSLIILWFCNFFVINF